MAAFSVCDWPACRTDLKTIRIWTHECLCTLLEGKIKILINKSSNTEKSDDQSCVVLIAVKTFSNLLSKIKNVPRSA
jgi:hypothetical protein